MFCLRRKLNYQGRVMLDELVMLARAVLQEQGSKGYWRLRAEAVARGLRPFDAMVAWQMAQGRSLEAARRIAAAIARRKR